MLWDRLSTGWLIMGVFALTAQLSWCFPITCALRFGFQQFRIYHPFGFTHMTALAWARMDPRTNLWNIWLHLRAIPHLTVIRPADANEVVEAWKYAVTHSQGPTVIALTRQAVPTIDRDIYASASGLERGAYTLADLGTGKPDLILMATGSEVSLILEAGDKLALRGFNVRLVSFPSWELFRAQPKEYQEAVLPGNVKARIAVEAGVAQGWREWVGDEGEIIAMDGYGASAPAKELFKQFGFTVEHIIEKADKVLKH